MLLVDKAVFMVISLNAVEKMLLIGKSVLRIFI